MNSSSTDDIEVIVIEKNDLTSFFLAQHHPTYIKT